MALWGGGAVARYGADGSLLATVRLPVDRPTSCAFGGSDHATLFVTTARAGLDKAALDRQPHAGHVFRFDGLDVRGMPCAPYRGANRLRSQPRLTAPARTSRNGTLSAAVGPFAGLLAPHLIAGQGAGGREAPARRCALLESRQAVDRPPIRRSPTSTRGRSVEQRQRIPHPHPPRHDIQPRPRPVRWKPAPRWQHTWRRRPASRREGPARLGGNPLAIPRRTPGRAAPGSGAM